MWLCLGGSFLEASPEKCLGKTSQRVEADMTNYRNKLSLRMEQWIITSREFLLKAYPKVTLS